MIKTYTQVPAVYYKESRDFQLLGRIYDVIFNYLKTNIDSIYHNPLDKSTDKNLLDLLACTLGLETRHNYDINQLYSICSCFSKIMKNKGTLYAIEILVNSLLNAQGINVEPLLVISKDNPLLVEIYIPSNLLDKTLLEDVLDYIIPVGMSYMIINSIALIDDNYTTTINSGKDSYELYKKSATESPLESGEYQPVNYIPRYEDIESGDSYGNNKSPGMIDNITITATK